MTAQRWQDWIVLILGAWLFLSPYALDHSPLAAATTNAYLVGLALVLFALLSLIEPRMWEEWVSFTLGGWLVVSPFVLGYSAAPAPAWNHVLVGLFVGATALMMITRTNATSARAVQ